MPKNIKHMTERTRLPVSPQVLETKAEFQTCEIAAAIVSDMIGKVSTVHKELSEKRFRKLEELLGKIVRTKDCQCTELKNVLRSFDLFQSALMPCLIREQYLLLPTILQKLTAESSGTAYSESYQGEIEDMIRTAGADHHRLQFLARQLVEDISVLIGKGPCHNIVRSFGALFDEFCEVLREQFSLEDAVLLPRCLSAIPKTI
ncbi:MAG: hypothetical protein KDB65_10800 [Calditrichaeota bacterium]|nr:hypothetical protein [Calditrichota bacterium]